MIEKINKPLLTLGIPTYSRCATVSKRVEELLKLELPEEMEILIIDNASTDGTYETLTKLCSGSSIRLLKNEQNLGFHGNFVQLIRNANGKYLLWSSDEDSIIEQNLKDLILLLRTKEPFFVATQYFLKGKLYRGRKKTAVMLPQDVWSMGHLPGLVFHVDASRKMFERFTDYLTQYPTIILYYPHVMVTIHLALQGDCYWWDKAIAEQIDFLPQLHPKDKQGSTYGQLKSRWAQWTEYTDYLKEISGLVPGNKKQILQKISESHNQRLLRLVRSGIAHENPDAIRYFDSEAKKMFGINNLHGKFLNKIKNLFKRSD